jgi:hypothetical protein
MKQTASVGLAFGAPWPEGGGAPAETMSGIVITTICLNLNFESLDLSASAAGVRWEAPTVAAATIGRNTTKTKARKYSDTTLSMALVCFLAPDSVWYARGQVRPPVSCATLVGHLLQSQVPCLCKLLSATPLIRYTICE